MARNNGRREGGITGFARGAGGGAVLRVAGRRVTMRYGCTAARLRLPIGEPLPAGDALRRGASLALNLRFALEKGALAIVADAPLRFARPRQECDRRRAAIDPDQIAVLRRAYAEAWGPRPRPRDRREAATDAIARLLEGPCGPDETVLDAETGRGEVRVRWFDDVLPVRVEADPRGIRLHRRAIAVFASAAPAAREALAAEALRIHARVRFARLVPDETGIVAEACLDPERAGPVELIRAARAVSAVARHAALPLEAIAAEPALAATCIEVLGTGVSPVPAG